MRYCERLSPVTSTPRILTSRAGITLVGDILRTLATDRRGRCELICFPHAGAGPSVFRSWPKYVSAQVNISAVHLPGREERIAERPDSDFSRVLDELTEAMTPLTNKPVILFGHSFGALLAAHVGQKLLSNRTEEGAILFVSARLPPWSNAPFRNWPGTRPVIGNPELADMVYAAMAADRALAETAYGLRESAVSFPVIALCGSDDIANPPLHMQEWSRFTSGAFHSVAIKGGHFFINSQTERIATLVDKCAQRMLAVARSRP
jgi:medium-chain acyl-[acyl-carrier-protein] hydrolase